MPPAAPGRGRQAEAGRQAGRPAGKVLMLCRPRQEQRRGGQAGLSGSSSSGSMSASGAASPVACLISWARGDSGLPVSLERGTSVGVVVLALAPSPPSCAERELVSAATHGHPPQVPSSAAAAARSSTHPPLLLYRRDEPAYLRADLQRRWAHINLCRIGGCCLWVLSLVRPSARHVLASLGRGSRHLGRLEAGLHVGHHLEPLQRGGGGCAVLWGWLGWVGGWLAGLGAGPDQGVDGPVGKLLLGWAIQTQAAWALEWHAGVPRASRRPPPLFT